MLWDSQTGTRLESVTVAPLCSACSDISRKSEGHFYPLSITRKSVLDGKEPRGKTQVRKPACSWLHTRRVSLFHPVLIESELKLGWLVLDFETAALMFSRAGT